MPSLAFELKINTFLHMFFHTAFSLNFVSNYIFKLFTLKPFFFIKLFLKNIFLLKCEGTYDGEDCGASMDVLAAYVHPQLQELHQGLVYITTPTIYCSYFIRHSAPVHMGGYMLGGFNSVVGYSSLGGFSSVGEFRFLASYLTSPVSCLTSLVSCLPFSYLSPPLSCLTSVAV